MNAATEGRENCAGLSDSVFKVRAGVPSGMRCSAKLSLLMGLAMSDTSEEKLFLVTREWVWNNRTLRGAWTRNQLAEIDVSWPPKQGWLSALKRRNLMISEMARLVFESEGRNIKLLS